MVILSVDDEELALDALNRVVLLAIPGAELHSYTDTALLLDDMQIRKFTPDVAFLDIDMPELNGLELTRLLKVVFPNVNVIFVTSYSQYALDAYALRPSGYLTKPVSVDRVKTELQNLRHPPERTKAEKRVQIHCFGNFDMYVDGKPVSFLRSKSKEMLAYLVDRRGGSCTAAQIASTLWEDDCYDRSKQKQIAAIRADLIKSLKAVGADGILSFTRDSMAVNPKEFDCDYYMALNGDAVVINSFTGEYMTQYSWAEFTTGLLTEKYIY